MNSFKGSMVGRLRVEELFGLPLLKWTSIHEDFEPLFVESGGICLNI